MKCEVERKSPQQHWKLAQTAGSLLFPSFSLKHTIEKATCSIHSCMHWCCNMCIKVGHMPVDSQRELASKPCVAAQTIDERRMPPAPSSCDEMKGGQRLFVVGGRQRSSRTRRWECTVVLSLRSSSFTYVLAFQEL